MDDYITVTEAAQMAGFCYSHLFNLIKNGEFKTADRVDCHWRIRRSEVKEWLDARRKVDEELLTLEQVAKRLDVTVYAVRQWADAGLIKTQKILGKHRIRPEDCVRPATRKRNVETETHVDYVTAAKLLGCNYGNVRNAVHDGRLQPDFVGSKPLIPRDQIQAILDARERAKSMLTHDEACKVLGLTRVRHLPIPRLIVEGNAYYAKEDIRRYLQAQIDPLVEKLERLGEIKPIKHL